MSSENYMEIVKEIFNYLGSRSNSHFSRIFQEFILLNILSMLGSLYIYIG